MSHETSHEVHRDSVLDLKFPRHTLVSLLVFVVCWEVLSHLAPVLGIPPFAIPSVVKIAKSFATITPVDIVVTLARVIVALLWFPGVEFRIGFVLVVVCGPVFLIDTLDAMRGVPRELRHMMRSFRPTTLQYFIKLMLPAIAPSIFTSWKVNISLAIRVVTIAELVGAVTGIGHQLSVAQELFSVADVFAWTLVLVALLFMLEAGVSRVERRVLR